jgi:hypothetical protein
MGSFETSETHKSPHHRPVRVPINKKDAYGAAREKCEDLGWEVVAGDEDALVLTCRCSGGLLGGSAEVVVRIEGPDGIPTSTTHVRSTSSGGLLSKDKSLVADFVRKFTMRTC